MSCGNLFSSCKGENTHIFGGFIVCGDCGYGGTGVTVKRNSHQQKYYECSMYRKYGKARCNTHRIDERYMLVNFKEFLKQIKKEYKELLNEINVEEIKKKSKNNKEKLEKELQSAKKEYKAMQIEKIKQITKNEQSIVVETFEQIEKEILEKINRLSNCLENLKNKNVKEKKENIKKTIDYFDEIIKADKPDKAILMRVLNKIIIYKDKTVQFKLKISIDKLI